MGVNVGVIVKYSCFPDTSPLQVLLVLLMLFLFVLVICYVFLIVGLELFALSTNDVLTKNYLQHYGCELVRKGPLCAAPSASPALPLHPLTAESDYFLLVCAPTSSLLRVWTQVSSRLLGVVVRACANADRAVESAKII